jgi:pimeloyl-ACP methyl ester carboxylesterase
VLLDGVGHFPHREAPELVANLLVEMLSESQTEADLNVAAK